MSRASRLSEIAKSNEPAFNGTYWWLADPTSSAPPAAAPVQESHSEELVSVAAAHASAQANSHYAEPRQTMTSQPVQLPASMAAALEIANESESASSSFASRLGGLREKFLWLGRRSRSLPQE